MLTDQEAKIYQQFLAKAIAQHAHHQGDLTSDDVFPIWSQMVHELLKARGCPCTTGAPHLCFEVLPQDKQKTIFRDHDHLNLLVWTKQVQRGVTELRS